MQVLVTGANGFIGQHLCPKLLETGHQVIAAIRHDSAPELPAAVECINVGDLTSDSLFKGALSNVDIIIHLAARTHVMKETEPWPGAAYRSINVEASRHLANEAVMLGVKRIVFLSSVKVNGERTDQDPFSANDLPAPEDDYGRSKCNAEIELQQATEGTKTELTIIRTPLVYGPGVKGNFLKLMQAIVDGKPLPLGRIRNRRSLCYVKNLCNALVTVLEHPAAPGQIYLVRDGEDLSTTALVQRMAIALNVHPCLFPVPAPLLRLTGQLIGQGAATARLSDSLQIDDRPIRNTLGWLPPYTVDQGLEETASWFKSRYSNSGHLPEEAKASDVP